LLAVAVVVLHLQLEAQMVARAEVAAAEVAAVLEII